MRLWWNRFKFNWFSVRKFYPQASLFQVTQMAFEDTLSIWLSLRRKETHR